MKNFLNNFTKKFTKVEESPSQKIFNSVKKLSSSRIFLALFFLSAGILSTLASQVLAKQKDQKNSSYITSQNFSDETVIFHDDFHRSVFQHMQQVEKEMNEIFARQQKEFEKTFEEISKNESNTKAKLVKKEDDDNYYYELYFSGFKKEDVVVGIKDDAVEFSAATTQNSSDKTAKKSEKKFDKDNKKLDRNSRFYYSMSLGEHNKEANPEIIKDDQKIIVKIAKAKRSNEKN